MSRIEFDGTGKRIPPIALPPFGGESDIPPTVLMFTENAEFSVAEYKALGFTHFEVWCVGAAGGRGGDVGRVTYGVEELMRPVPQSVWNLQLEIVAYNDYFKQVEQHYQINPNWWGPVEWGPGQAHGAGLQPFWQWGFPATYYDGRPYLPAPLVNRVYTGGNAGWYRQHTQGHWLYDDSTAHRWRDIIYEFGLDPVAWQYWDGTYAQLYDYMHQSHYMVFRTYRQALLYPTNDGMGGGGGGGGLYKTAGSLDELPDVMPIVVGKVGADAGLGQVQKPGVFTTKLQLYPQDPNYYVHPYKRREVEIRNYFEQYLTSYPPPYSSFDNPQPGEDGGASSFGEVAQASGGKGGGPGMVWDGSKFVPKGDGGAGGAGGRLEAGGGAAGSALDNINGADGTWIPITGIGKGGGGGKGGRPTSTFAPYQVGELRHSLAYSPGYGSGSYTPVYHYASAGGQGSFSYADTTVFGQRQFRQAWSYMRPDETPHVVSPDGKRLLSTGQFVYKPITTTELIIPGGGGGARPMPNVKVGSKAVGFSPNGIVILRLVKI